MPRATLWQQTVTLVKRNFLLKQRMKQESFQEILIPIYFIVLLAILKTFSFKPTAYPAVNSTELPPTTFMPPPASPWQFYVAPNVTNAKRLMDIIGTTVLPNTSYTLFDSQEAMDSAYRNLAIKSTTVGILFQDSTIYKYALRFPYSSFSDSFIDFYQGNCRVNPENNQPQSCFAKAYLNVGFATIQSAVDTAIAKMINSNFTGMAISAREMPKDPTLANTEMLRTIGPLYLVMTLGPFLAFLLIFIVQDKEKKIKEGMKMMGLDDLAYWFSCGIIYAASLFVMTLVMTVIGYFGKLWPLSNFFLVFLFLFIYGLSIEMLGYMITPFFSKSKTAGTVGSMLFLIISLIFLAIQLTDDFPDSAVWALSLLSPTAFAFVMSKVFYFESTGEGAQFSNLVEGSNPMYIGLVMMIVDIFLYFILTLYLDNVIPTEYGQRKPFFYFLQPSYWSRKKRGISRGRMIARDSLMSPQSYSPSDFEAVFAENEGNEAISFKGIRKVFRQKSLFDGFTKETIAIKNFTLDIYKGQITALLGHNGAGKTTLFNILTGLVPSTAGSATVYGYDVSHRNDMVEIRKITGVCPQHDILIDCLSVIEHLEIFAGIKGYTGQEKTAEVERVLGVIDLQDQRNTLAKKLSGGQKRKLSVGIAILGDPKILILDEPTAGMDPYSRRKLWDLLRSNQKERVTLLTTHFMDEADILADRKVILTRGKLRCVGSSLFLKNRFGVGYHLSVVSKSHDDGRAITACVDTHIRDAKLKRSIGLEHAYILPLSQVSSFPALFSDLNEKQDELNVQSYGVSMTTLEEVFLKIGEDDEEEEENERYGNKESHKFTGFSNPADLRDQVTDRENVAINLETETPTFDPKQSEVAGEISGARVLLQLMRRILLINIRNPGYVFFGILLPIVTEVAGTWYYTTSGSNSDSDDRNIYDVTYQNNLNDYKDQSVLYTGLTGLANNSFVANIPSGVNMEANSLTDAELLKKGFYPHFIGLNMLIFNLTQLVYMAQYNTSYQWRRVIWGNRGTAPVVF